jgi:hypothetical protein
MIGAEMSEDVGEVLLVAVHYFSYVLHVVPDILVSSVFALFQSCIFISASPPQNYVIGRWVNTSTHSGGLRRRCGQRSGIYFLFRDWILNSILIIKYNEEIESV